jgi:hypothetical protein
MLSCLGAYARASLRFPVRQRLSRTLAPLLQLRRHTSARADSNPTGDRLTKRSALCKPRWLDALAAARVAVSFGCQRGASGRSTPGGPNRAVALAGPPGDWPSPGPIRLPRRRGARWDGRPLRQDPSRAGGSRCLGGAWQHCLEVGLMTVPLVGSAVCENPLKERSHVYLKLAFAKPDPYCNRSWRRASDSAAKGIKPYIALERRAIRARRPHLYGGTGPLSPQARGAGR